jgi:hypothetical protein
MIFIFTLLLVGLFLPLYPLSAVHNALFMRLIGVPRVLLLLIWPQIGVWLLYYLPTVVPDFVIPNEVVIWATASAALYALRLLTVRDLGLWATMLASSALALGWGLAANGSTEQAVHLFVLGFSLPAALLVLLANQLTQRFGAAYAGLSSGLAISHPRLAGMLVLCMLAATATPVFPAFFSMLKLIQILDWGFGLALLAIWLTWSWAGALLLQGFVFGAPRTSERGDLCVTGTVMYGLTLLALIIAGLILTGGGL